MGLLRASDFVALRFEWSFNSFPKKERAGEGASAVRAVPLIFRVYLHGVPSRLSSPGKLGGCKWRLSNQAANDLPIEYAPCNHRRNLLLSTLRTFFRRGKSK